MDYQNNEYDRTGERYTGNQKLYCDLCFRRCRGIYHVIEQGDTLYSLGKRYHVSVSDLIRANPYVNVYNLRIGEELCIPVRPPRPQPRDNNEEDWMDQMREMREIQEGQGEIIEQGQELEPDYVEQEELKESNQFSENDSIKDVLDKTGLSMSDFMKFLSQKMD